MKFYLFRIDDYTIPKPASRRLRVMKGKFISKCGILGDFWMNSISSYLRGQTIAVILLPVFGIMRQSLVCQSFTLCSFLHLPLSLSLLLRLLSRAELTSKVVRTLTGNYTTNQPLGSLTADAPKSKPTTSLLRLRFANFKLWSPNISFTLAGFWNPKFYIHKYLN